MLEKMVGKTIARVVIDGEFLRVKFTDGGVTSFYSRAGGWSVQDSGREKANK